MPVKIRALPSINPIMRARESPEMLSEAKRYVKLPTNSNSAPITFNFFILLSFLKRITHAWYFAKVSEIKL